jgi:hypothetical protein
MPDNPVMTLVTGAGGFVMEQRMLLGIRDRAEGRTDPPYSEVLEIVLWLTVLVAGIAAGVFFLNRPQWQLPLVIGAASVIVLFVFTFVQPAVWMRALADALLWAGVVVGARKIAG